MKIFASFSRTKASPCPRCHSVLHSVTGLGVSGPIRPYPGAVTICDQCAAWLTFTDTLALRHATEAEIKGVHPDMRTMARRLAYALMVEETKQ